MARRDSDAKAELVAKAAPFLGECGHALAHFHGHAHGETNPIASTAAFAHFVDGHGERRQGDIDQQNASLVGAYVTQIG